MEFNPRIVLVVLLVYMETLEISGFSKPLAAMIRKPDDSRKITNTNHENNGSNDKVGPFTSSSTDTNRNLIDSRSSFETEECGSGEYWHGRGKQCVPKRCTPRKGFTRHRDYYTGECKYRRRTSPKKKGIRVHSTVPPHLQTVRRRKYGAFGRWAWWKRNRNRHRGQRKNPPDVNNPYWNDFL